MKLLYQWVGSWSIEFRLLSDSDHTGSVIAVVSHTRRQRRSPDCPRCCWGRRSDWSLTFFNFCTRFEGNFDDVKRRDRQISMSFFEILFFSISNFCRKELWVTLFYDFQSLIAKDLKSSHLLVFILRMYEWYLIFLWWPSYERFCTFIFHIEDAWMRADVFVVVVLWAFLYIYMVQVFLFVSVMNI